MKKPELLAPAGDFEKLRAAINYGADAVYLGARDFSLRAKAKNFDLEELETAVSYAHKRSVSVYVAANIFARNADLEKLPGFFRALREIGADAAIISDPGVFAVCREAAPGLPIHISTQANTTNSRAVSFWRDLGAARIILARELSFAEISEIRSETGASPQLEIFVHGAMCVSMSGRCLLSDYMTGRGGNSGECAQPCRYEYHLMEQKRPGEYMPVFEDGRGTYILNSKDLCLIGHMPGLFALDADSFKIEGRMKSPYYAASVVKAYRSAMDDFVRDPDLYRANLPLYAAELEKNSHRPYTAGFAFGNPGGALQSPDNPEYVRTAEFLGLVLSYDEETGAAEIEQRNKFYDGQEVEFLRPGGFENFSQTIHGMTDENGQALAAAPRPRQIVKIKTDRPVKEMDMMRTKTP